VSRSIKTSNAAFQQRVAAATGGVEFLELCGFQVGATMSTTAIRGQESKPVLHVVLGEEGYLGSHVWYEMVRMGDAMTV
jgi:hypothetical protein